MSYSLELNIDAAAPFAPVTAILTADSDNGCARFADLDDALDAALAFGQDTMVIDHTNRLTR